MTDYLVTLTCAKCGGDLSHVAEGVTRGASVAAVAACTECAARWVVRVEMLSAGVVDRARDGQPIDTPAQPRAMTTCKVCGAEMEKYRRAGRGGKARVTCGPECAKANWSAQSRARHAAQGAG